MACEVFIADDSKNIHKVITIILEDRDCEFKVCENKDNLFHNLDLSSPHIIFLDFHLSDDGDGYELAKKIKSTSLSKVVLIFGTFDNVDEDKLEDSGVDGYLFKPLDGDKLLNIFDRFDMSQVVEKTQSSIDTHGLDNDLDLPSVINEFAEIKTEDDDFSDLDLPGVIGAEDTRILSTVNPENLEDEIELPGVIDSNVSLEGSLLAHNNDDIVLPAREDLAYPDQFKVDKEEEKIEEQIPKLISSDILVDIEEDDDFEIELGNEPIDEEVEEKKLDKLKSEILKELDHDLWDGDNTNTHISTAQFKEALALEKMKDSILERVKRDQKSLKSEIRDEVLNTLSAEVDKKIPKLEKVSEKLAPGLEDIVRQEIRSVVREELHKLVEEKIWRELPQIAEKIISSELNEIKNSIID